VFDLYYLDSASPAAEVAGSGDFRVSGCQVLEMRLHGMHRIGVVFVWFFVFGVCVLFDIIGNLKRYVGGLVHFDGSA
jgi:hypothetical protein